MSLADLTLDTNVLLHSCNSGESRQAHSVKLLKSLLSCTASIAIDKGFSIDPAMNRSLIGAEYLEKLVPGTLPSSIITHLARTGRISEVSASLPAQSSKQLNQLVSNRRDRTFIKVCANSIGKTFVSHDFIDFSSPKRQRLGRLFNVAILDAHNCLACL